MFASSDRALEVRVGAVLGRSDRPPPGPAPGEWGGAGRRPGGGEPTGPRPLSNPSGTSSRTAVTGCGQNSRTRDPPDSGRGRYSRTSAVASDEQNQLAVTAIAMVITLSTSTATPA